MKYAGQDIAGMPAVGQRVGERIAATKTFVSFTARHDRLLARRMAKKSQGG